VIELVLPAALDGQEMTDVYAGVKGRAMSYPVASRQTIVKVWTKVVHRR